jgi:hypothetical protein
MLTLTNQDLVELNALLDDMRHREARQISAFISIRLRRQEVEEAKRKASNVEDLKQPAS